MTITYVLYYDHSETNGDQVVWDGDRGDGVPKHYASVDECLQDFIETEEMWGTSLYAVPPQIREVLRQDDPSEIQETGQVWEIIDNVAVPK